MPPEVAREVRVGNATFEKFLYPVPQTDRIRIYLLDITERKAHEVKLNRLNHLLLTIRNINEYLLVAESDAALYRFVCEALKGFEDIVGVIIGLRLPDYVLKPVAWAGFSEAMISPRHRQDRRAGRDTEQAHRLVRPRGRHGQDPLALRL